MRTHAWHTPSARQHWLQLGKGQSMLMYALRTLRRAAPPGPATRSRCVRGDMDRLVFDILSALILLATALIGGIHLAASTVATLCATGAGAR